MDWSKIVNDSIIVALISVGVTLAVTIISSFLTAYFTDKKSRREILARLGTSDTSLCGEHKNILAKGEDIKSAVTKTGESIYSAVTKTNEAFTAYVTEYKVDKANSISRFENLTEKQKDIKESINNLLALQTELEKVNYENKQLQNEIIVAKLEIKQLTRDYDLLKNKTKTDRDER